MFPKRLALLVFALVAYAHAMSAYATAPEPCRNTSADLEKQLTYVEAVTAKIEVTSLSVTYSEGKYIESTRSRVVKYTQILRRELDRFCAEPTVTRLLVIVTGLRDLESQVDSLIHLLGDVQGLPPRTMQLAAEWAAAMGEKADPLNKASIAFQSAAEKYAGQIDALLARCRASK